MATSYRRSGYQHDPELAYLRYQNRKRREAAAAARREAEAELGTEPGELEGLV